MWAERYQEELDPVELHEQSLEELTGIRPSHRGALMYLKQKGIPADAAQFRRPERGQLKQFVRAIEHDFNSAPVTKYPEVHPPPGLYHSARVRPVEVARPSAGRHHGDPNTGGGRAMSSRELMTGRRDGRAAALFQRMKDRSDQFVIDESSVPNSCQLNQQGYGDRDRPWQRSPWEVAAEHPMGIPDEAFDVPMPKPKPKPKLQNAAHVQKRGPPGYTEVDTIRQRQQAPQPGHKPVKIGCTWKGSNDIGRFHGGVRPYEMNYNRTARGWNPVEDDAISDGGQASSRDKGAYFDFNTRPKSWHQEDDEVAFHKRTADIQHGGRPRPGEMARSRQMVRAVIGPKTWVDQSDDL